MHVAPGGASLPRIDAATTAAKADEETTTGEPPARTVNYPRVDEDALARRIFSDEYSNRPGSFTKRLIGGAIGGVVLGGAGFGLRSALKGYDGGAAPMAAKIAFGAIAGAIGAGLGAWLIGNRLNKMTPERARGFASDSLDMDARSRPPLPPASAAPTEQIGMPGVVRDGISGSTVGGIVQLKQEVMGDVTTRSTTTRNSAGEPTIVIGTGSGEQITTETVIRTENARLNSIGLGRVLYDPNGYGSMSEATEAYDGKHAAAIVKDGDRYLLVDVDAENWDALGDRSQAMSLADERVKAVFANKGVYYPSSIGSSGEAGPRLFMFAQEQDIDMTVPPNLQDLEGQPIGTYETNASTGRGQFGERYQLHVTGFHGGDAYSGPGWTDRAEAIQHMVRTDGQQALMQSGDRYYVANLGRRDAQGNEAGLDTITGQSPDGAAIIGLRTTDDAHRVELIEDEGGIFAPVDDWWVRARTEQR